MEDYEYRAIIEGLFGDGRLRLDAAAEYELRHDDYVMEMPQSGSGEVWVMEAISTYDGDDVYLVTDIFEFRDGKIGKETRYYAQPFEAPAWRARWVERM